MESDNIFPMMHVRQKHADFKGWNAVQKLLITVGREGERSDIIFNVSFQRFSHTKRETVKTISTAGAAG